VVARRQQRSSGQSERVRCFVSRPRNHFTPSKGTPTLTEYCPSFAFSTREVHQ